MGNGSCKQEWVGSREYKIILNPARFKASREKGMKQMWDIVAKIAKKLDIEIVASLNTADPGTRQVRFLDTPEYEMYEKDFVFRLRGTRDPNTVEGTLKYRNEDFFISRKMDLSCSEESGYKNDCKFENDMTAKNIIYQTRSNTIEIKSENVGKIKTIADLAEIFPAVEDLGIDKNAVLDVVNGVLADETAVKTKKILQFKDNVKADICFNFWHIDGVLTVAEFSFDYDMPDEGITKETAIQADKFMEELKKMKWWYDPTATTKTALVYGKAAGSGAD